MRKNVFLNYLAVFFVILFWSAIVAQAGDKLVTTMSGRTYYDVADEDTMSSDSNIMIPTQQSVKAYVDSGTGVLTNKTLDDATVKFGDTADATKDLFFSVGGATTAKTMTIISSQTDDRSLTLPDVTDTLVGKTTTDTLTNKTLTSPTLTTPALGTPASGVLTSCTGLPMTTGVTGTLPVANGGTGVTASTGTVATVLSTSPTLITPLLGTPTSGVMTNCTGLPMTTGVTGILPTANGGSGIAFFTAAGPTVARVYTFPDAAATIARTDAGQTFTGVNTMTSPIFITPALGTPASGTLTSCTGLPSAGLTAGAKTHTIIIPVPDPGSADADITAGYILWTPSVAVTITKVYTAAETDWVAAAASNDATVTVTNASVGTLAALNIVTALAVGSNTTMGAITNASVVAGTDVTIAVITNGSADAPRQNIQIEYTTVN